MTYDVGDALRSEKNKPASGSPWVLIYEVTNDSATQILRLAKNSENVTWNGETYYAFPISFDVLESNSEGDLPQITMTVSNASRQLAALVRRADSFVDAKVQIRAINSAFPTAARDFGGYVVNSASITVSEIRFNLSPHSLFDERFPRRLVAPRCSWVYRSADCGWPSDTASLPSGVSDIATCSKLLHGPNGCSAHGLAYVLAGATPLHPERWGGFDVSLER